MWDLHLPQRDALVRRRLRISGTVQGVGFRPFVHRVACELGLTGSVGNDGEGVWCELQGPIEAVDRAIARIRLDHPPLAVVEDLHQSELGLRPDERRFEVSRSTAADVAGPSLIPPDVAICGRCLAELRDPADRRFGYPFTCCTDCGPRYTVTTGLPYDRERTALAAFPLCADCTDELTDPEDRRFHAQAICCPACGPRPALLRANQSPLVDDVVERAAALVDAGSIVALKGLGGYQLVCRADMDHAVEALRERKRRDEKPFALLVSDLAQAGDLVELDRVAARALAGPEAPIVLARARRGAAVARSVAPGTGLLGVMLPATGLHALLVDAVGAPLVCTSGNLSGEPIIVDDATAEALVGDVVDAVLTHDRRIERRADDSVGQVVGGDFQLLRRARGFVPRRVRLSSGGPPVLAVGAELKSTVCLAVDDSAHLSPHLGDLENPQTLLAFEHAVADLIERAGVAPELVVHDLHPEYLSTKFAAGQDLAPVLGAQHHHAHLAACLADNRVTGPAIGVTFDGIGYGPDATAWGGEILVGDAAEARRFAHLEPVPMPGGVEAIRHPWRMAIAHLRSALGDDLGDVALLDRHHDWRDVASVCALDSTLMTTSIGRLFDAVAALCGVRDTVTYEGQAAIGLEELAEVAGPGYRFHVDASTEPVRVDARPVVRSVVAELGAGVPPSAVAGRFHAGVASVVGEVCRQALRRTGPLPVVVSGGVFQNRLLVELVVAELGGAGIEVLRHRQVPPNDGGIALGQVEIGRAALRLGRTEGYGGTRHEGGPG